MSRKSLDQLPRKHLFTVVVSLDELFHLNDLADAIGITRNALGLRLLRLGLEHFKAEHLGTAHQAQG